MDEPDPLSLTRTLGRLLRGARPELASDDGWVDIADAASAATQSLGLAVTPEAINGVLRSAGLERQGDRIRTQPRQSASRPPDVLWLATTREKQAEAIRCGEATEGIRPLSLHLDAPTAWRAAHIADGDPAVLVVDVMRARRGGVVFDRHPRTGAWSCASLPLPAILNLQAGFGEQISAGGLPCLWQKGAWSIALIRVERRRGCTWEVAKGKLELGEPPEVAAAREVTEEMGLCATPVVTVSLGAVHYGFLAPGGAPRLKTVHLYMMDAVDGPLQPAESEGIRDVRWFQPDDACRAVTHPSLTGVMRRVRSLIARRGPPR